MLCWRRHHNPRSSTGSYCRGLCHTAVNDNSSRHPERVTFPSRGHVAPQTSEEIPTDRHAVFVVLEVDALTDLAPRN